MPPLLYSYIAARLSWFAIPLLYNFIDVQVYSAAVPVIDFIAAPLLCWVIPLRHDSATVRCRSCPSQLQHDFIVDAVRCGTTPLLHRCSPLLHRRLSFCTVPLLHGCAAQADLVLCCTVTALSRWDPAVAQLSCCRSLLFRGLVPLLSGFSAV